MSEHHIFFSSSINPNTANEFANLIGEIQHQGATRINMAINTAGGAVDLGILMYNLMRSLTSEVTVHNVGNVDSIGNAVFLGGKHRYACPASTFMFHGIGFDLSGNQRLEEKNLESMLDTVLAGHNRISNIIAERTGVKVNDAMDLFKQQKTRDAIWAKDHGIISEIKEFVFPVGGNLHLFIRQ